MNTFFKNHGLEVGICTVALTAVIGIGVSGMMSTTPMMIMIVVTMLETAIEIVEITSPSSLEALTLAE